MRRRLFGMHLPTFLPTLLLMGACAHGAGAPAGTPAEPAPETASETAPDEPWNYERHVAERSAEIAASPIERGGVLFVGDSITLGGGDWSARFPGVAASNQGIGGDRTEALLGRMATITRGTPERVFLMIGTNDLSGGLTVEAVAEGAVAVARGIRRGIPDAELYVQSVLPREAAMADAVEAVNARLAAAADEAGYTYLDIHGAFDAGDGSLEASLTEDDLHLNEAGYARWSALIEPCVRRGCEGL